MALSKIVIDGGAAGPSWLVQGGMIVSTRAKTIDAPGAERLDAGFAARVDVSPGDVCAHTHLYSGLAPLGMPAAAPAPQNFLQILERVWWKLDRALDEKSLRASARLYIAESLLAGTTTLIDHHESPALIDGSLDILGDAAHELGIRLITCYGATERNRGRDEAKKGLAECARFIKANTRPLVQGMVGLHASLTASDDTIREAGALCRELKVPLHIHLAEDSADVVDAKTRGYHGPLERLIALDALPRGSILAHGVHVDGGQAAAGAEAGCWWVQNPRSNAGNKVGYPHGLGSTHKVALGTDGYPADMAAELHALVEQSGLAGDRALIADHELLPARWRGGWRIAGERYGAMFLPPLAVGGAADLKIRSFAAAVEQDEVEVLHEVKEGQEVVAYELSPIEKPLPPRHVIVAGRIVVKDGALVTGDLDAIRAEAKEQAALLWKRMEAL